MPIIIFVSFLLIHKSAYQKKKVRFASCFGCSFQSQSVWVPRRKRTTYKLIFRVVIVLEYQILNVKQFLTKKKNVKQFRDGLVWVSILVRKMLDLRHVSEVHFGRKGFGYRDTRERPINLYSVLS